MENESSIARAEMHGVQPEQLMSLLHGDLDWITMKALEKDRRRRYGTPSEWPPTLPGISTMSR